MRRIGPLIPLIVACAAGTEGTGERDRPNCAWRVCVQSVETSTGRVYRAVNREPVPATVLVTFHSLQNFGADVSLPAETVVRPRSSETLVRLRRIQGDWPAVAEPTIAIDLGASDTRPDADVAYAVPFGGEEPRRVSQGFNGEESHLGGMRYSLDFAMPEGTPVLAARSGRVLYVQDGFTEGGPDPDLLQRANVVVVAHRDATMASYGHLAPGIRVSRGQRVRTGDVLGLSGSTGFSGQPHLHFHVGLRLLRDPGRTIPITVHGPDGEPLSLAVGAAVPPNRANRARP